MKLLFFLALFASILLLRACFVKALLPSKLQESYNKSIIVNIFSYFTLIISYGLVSIIFSINTHYNSYITAALIIILSILQDCGVFKYFFKKVALTRIFIIALFLNTISWGTLIYILILCTDFKEDQYRISCTSNLKQIGLSLKQYAMDYDNYFPDKGLEQIRSNDYLTDVTPYNCPSTKTQKLGSNQPLTNKNIDYIYRAGLHDPPVDGKDSSKIPVLWDKPTNHKGYGNVLFLDGHVKGFAGANWMEQAGIKKIVSQQ